MPAHEFAVPEIKLGMDETFRFIVSVLAILVPHAFPAVTLSTPKATNPLLNINEIIFVPTPLEILVPVGIVQL